MNGKTNNDGGTMLRKYLISILILLIMGTCGYDLEDTSPENPSDEANLSTSTRGNVIIASSTTWTASNSPYVITGNVLVKHGAILTIQPGVEVRFGPEDYLQVEGKLMAIGNGNSRIRFTSNQVAPDAKSWEDFRWDGIKFTNMAQNGSEMRYCTIEHSSYGVEVGNQNLTVLRSFENNYMNNTGGGLDFFMVFEASNYEKKDICVTLANNTIQNIHSNGIKVGIVAIGAQDVDLTGLVFDIINNSILDCRSGIYFMGEDIALNISDNILYNNDCGIEADDHSVVDGSGGQIIIERNLIWGSTDSGIELPDTHCSIEIANNTITQNKNGISIGDGNKPYTHHNNIYNNTEYDLMNGLGSWDVKHNWWGTTNTTQISNQIFDYDDDFNKGKVTYIPPLNSKAYFPDRYASILTSGIVPDDIDSDEHDGGDTPDDHDSNAGGDDTASTEYDPLKTPIADGRVCAEISIDRDGGITTAAHAEGFTIDLVSLDSNEISVVVDGVSQQGKLVVIYINLDCQFRVSDVNHLELKLDGVPIGSALYSTVLSSRGETALYTLIASSEGTQIVVYVPHFSEREISIRQKEDAREPSDGMDFLAITLLPIVILFYTAVLIIVLRKKRISTDSGTSSERTLNTERSVKLPSGEGIDVGTMRDELIRLKESDSLDNTKGDLISEVDRLYRSGDISKEIHSLLLEDIKQIRFR